MRLLAFLLLLTVITTGACAPRGPDPAGEPQGPRPECDTCPELRVRLKRTAFEVGGKAYPYGELWPPQRAGRTLIIIENIDRQTHTLRLSGPDGAQTTPVIGVGQTGYLVADLQAGKYEVERWDDNRPQTGMTATLIVE